MPRDRGQAVQEKVNAVKDRIWGELTRAEYSHLKDRLMEYELVDEKTLVIHFLFVNKVDEGDIRTIKGILGEDTFCEISTHDANHLRVSFMCLLP
jgi:hypothetical protein